MYICYFARTENKDEFKAVKENENNPFRIHLNKIVNLKE